MKELKLQAKKSLEEITGFNVQNQHVSTMGAMIAMSASLEDFNATLKSGMSTELRNKIRYIGYGLFSNTNISTEQVADLEDKVFEFLAWRKKVSTGATLESFSFMGDLALESFIGITSTVSAETLNSLSDLKGSDRKLMVAVSHLSKLYEAEQKGE